jgi:hypothetical protein
LILSAHCIFLRRCFGWHCFSGGNIEAATSRYGYMKTKRYIISYIERFPFFIGDGVLRVSTWKRGKISLNLFLDLSHNGYGGQGVGVQRLSVLVWWALRCCPWYWMVWDY